jgi:hypothetical protein
MNPPRVVAVLLFLGLASACSSDPSSAAGAMGKLKDHKAEIKPKPNDQTNIKGVIMPIDSTGIKATVEPETNVKGLLMPPIMEATVKPETNVKGLIMPPIMEATVKPETNIKGLIMPPIIEATVKPEATK